MKKNIIFKILFVFIIINIINVNLFCQDNNIELEVIFFGFSKFSTSYLVYDEIKKDEHCEFYNSINMFVLNGSIYRNKIISITIDDQEAFEKSKISIYRKYLIAIPMGSIEYFNGFNMLFSGIKGIK